MTEKNDIVSFWKLRDKPSIPEGFFEQFSVDLMQKIEQDSGFLGQLTKSKKPALPNGFFDQLINDMPIAKSDFNLDKLTKRDLPTVPVGYFDQFYEQLAETLQKEVRATTKKGRIIPLRIIAAVGAVAATIALVISVVNYSSNTGETAGNQVAETVIDEEVYDAYLTYLDEDEIIDYIVENDIEIGEGSDSVHVEDYIDYSAADIEDFYLELL